MLLMSEINGNGTVSRQPDEISLTWTHCVVKFFPFVEPDLGNSRGILEHNVGDTSWESVRRFIAENVSDV